MDALFSKSHGRRWTMFNAVGLAILRDVLGLHYLLATVVAMR